MLGSEEWVWGLGLGLRKVIIKCVENKGAVIPEFKTCK